MQAAKLINSILKVTLGVMIFLVAIRLFSRTLKGSFSHKLKPLFDKCAKNRFVGLAVGAGATVVMQSSTATTVLTVGLVQAGVLSLFSATAIIMGANVGTTLTSVIVALSAFPIRYIFMGVGAAGLILIMISKKHAKLLPLGSVLFSFGLVFVGLWLLSIGFSTDSPLAVWFSRLFTRVNFPLLLILLGAIFTAIIQSSSASVAIYMALLASGALTLNSAIFLLFGSEIGTCTTTLFASAKGSKEAKQAALIHLIFNLISMIIFTAIFWPLGRFILPPFSRAIPSVTMQLSIFQIAYNVITVFILIWFTKPLIKLVEKLTSVSSLSQRKSAR